MNFWRRKKREEFTANNINAGNGKTGTVPFAVRHPYIRAIDYTKRRR